MFQTGELVDRAVKQVAHGQDDAAPVRMLQLEAHEQ
jgi:hypothetical protein